jgi:hypothetical protein
MQQAGGGALGERHLRDQFGRQGVMEIRLLHGIGLTGRSSNGRLATRGAHGTPRRVRPSADGRVSGNYSTFTPGARQAVGTVIGETLLEVPHPLAEGQVARGCVDGALDRGQMCRNYSTCTVIGKILIPIGKSRSISTPRPRRPERKYSYRAKPDM